MHTTFPPAYWLLWLARCDIRVFGYLHSIQIKDSGEAGCQFHLSYQCQYVLSYKMIYERAYQCCCEIKA